MPIKKPSLRNLVLLLSGTATCFLWHSFLLGQIPGLHFDEAWAANHAWRIAYEPGFWPWQAMSPYTVSWTHYVGALFLRVFGTSVLIFRLSQLTMACLGIFLLSLAWQHWRIQGDKKRIGEGVDFVTVLVPFLALFSIPLFFNHRFAIELTGFHSFCFGLFAYGIATQKQYIGAAGILLGVTAHALFLAVPLALCMNVFLWHPEKIKDYRKMGILVGVILLPFYAHIASQIPKPAKAYLLITLNVTVLVIMHKPNLLNNRYLNYVRRTFFGLAILAAAVFGINIALFLEGNWFVLKHIGAVSQPLLWGIGLVPWLVFVAMGLRQARATFLPASENASEKRFLLFLTVILGAIMLTQAPRYYHLVFLSLVVWQSQVLQQLRISKRVFVFGTLACSQMLILWLNYFAPALTGKQVEHSFRFLGVKDSSRDFLPKRPALEFYAAQGCSPDIVQSADARIELAFKVLRREIEPDRTKKCNLAKVMVERRDDSNYNNKKHFGALVAVQEVSL